MAGFLDTYFWWRPFGAVAEISAQNLERQLANGKDKPQLLDVRTHAEWQSGVIDGAVLVQVQDLKSRIDGLDFDKSKPVIAICRSAHRSIGAVRLLKAAGYEDPMQLQGGMLVWRGKTVRP